MKKKLIGLTTVLTLTLMTACNSTTLIRSSDEQARIYVNGEYLGTGQATYTDQKVAFSQNSVEIRRDGCLSQSHSFRRSEKADIGAIIGGVFVLVPFLWVTEYKPDRSYDYQCLTEAEPA